MRFSKNTKMLTIISLCLVAATAMSLLLFESPIPLLVGSVCLLAAVIFSVCPKSVIYAIVVYCLVVKWLIADAGLPSALNYALDAMVGLAFVFALTKQRRTGLVLPWRQLWIPIGMFFGVAILSAILHANAPGLVLWGIRYFARFFLFLYAAFVLLDKSDIRTIATILAAFLFANLLMVSIQYFALDYRDDRVNGFFGSDPGGNSSMNVYLVGLCLYALMGYRYKRVKLTTSLIIVFSSLYIASLSELKIFYFELLMLIALAFVMAKPSFRTIMITIVSIIAVIGAIELFTFLYPSWSGFFSVESILGYVGESHGYSNSTDLNRLTAVPTLNDLFMDGVIEKLFGLGLGAGQYSQFFASPLYALYGNSLNWLWFTDATVFLESGFVGLLLYVLFYVFYFGCAWRAKRNTDASWVFTSGAALLPYSLLLLVYSSVLSTEPGGYLWMLFMLPPMIQKKEQGEGLSGKVW